MVATNEKGEIKQYESGGVKKNIMELCSGGAWKFSGFCIFFFLFGSLKNFKAVKTFT